MSETRTSPSDKDGQFTAIKLADVQRITGLPKSGIYARLDTGNETLRDESFPQPFSYSTGRGVFWVEEEVVAWVKSQVEKFRADPHKRREKRALPHQ